MNNKRETITMDGEIITPPFIRTMYNYDRDGRSNATGTICPEPTRAIQSFKDETDINLLMKRYSMTGEMPQYIRPVLPEEYDDVTDFASAMNTVRRASEAFMQLPSGVRARFQNNPQVFTEFFAHEENREEAIKMGLIIPRPAPVAQVPEKVENPPKE